MWSTNFIHNIHSKFLTKSSPSYPIQHTISNFLIDTFNKVNYMN